MQDANQQFMPHLEVMAKGNLEKKDWLRYYKNVWVRNLTARLIDVETDKVMKAADPEQVVLLDDGQSVPVKVRLEHRKIMVQDAVDLIAGIDLLMALSDEELDKKAMPEALVVDEDMKPKAEGAVVTPTNDDPAARGAVDEGQAPATTVDEVKPEEPKEEPSAEAAV